MRIYVAGIAGMVGSSIAFEAQRQGYEVVGKTLKELDLTDRPAVFREFAKIKPTHLVIAAAKVGGIGANSSFPVDFLSTNLQIQTNLMDAAHAVGIQRVLFLGSSCVYPKHASQPIKESALLTGELEPSNAPYAIAKIAGLKLIEAYRVQYGHHWIAAMPTNLYGPRDNFDSETAHVIPALINRFHFAKLNFFSSVEVWGDGSPLREFLYVNDLAKACLVLLEKFESSLAINIGSGQEISIKNLSSLIAKIVGFTGEVRFNSDRPNGTPKKLLDSSQISEFGWKPQVGLEEGITLTYNWFLANHTKEWPL